MKIKRKKDCRIDQQNIHFHWEYKKKKTGLNSILGWRNLLLFYSIWKIYEKTIHSHIHTYIQCISMFLFKFISFFIYFSSFQIQMILCCRVGILAATSCVIAIAVLSLINVVILHGWFVFVFFFFLMNHLLQCIYVGLACSAALLKQTNQKRSIFCDFCLKIV